MFTHLDDPNPPSPSPVRAMQVAASGARRRRRRRRLIGSAAAALVIVATAIAVQQQMAGDDEQQVVSHGPSTTTTSAPSTTGPTSTTTDSSTTTASTTTAPTTTVPSTTLTPPQRADEAAAEAFIDAWRTGDAGAMREVAADEQVDVAMGWGTATGEPDCIYQRSGQYQCIIGVSSGKQVYILVGPPGASAGRVWWVAQYAPGS